MSFAPMDRRTLLRSGATAACVTFTGLGTVPARAVPIAISEPLTQPLVGWLVVTSTGGGQLTLTEVEEGPRPGKILAVEPIPPLTSVAGMARHANAAIVKIVADSWQVPAADCTCTLQRIEHHQSGRSIPFAVWTDFA